jgi:hypothetical protein
MFEQDGRDSRLAYAALWWLIQTFGVATLFAVSIAGRWFDYAHSCLAGLNGHLTILGIVWGIPYATLFLTCAAIARRYRFGPSL